MPDFGWTRLAYLLFVLAVLTTLVELANQGTDSHPLASEPPDEVAAAAPRPDEPHEAAREPREAARATPGVAAALPASVEDRLEDMTTDAPGAALTTSAPDTRPPIFHRPAPTSPPAGSGDVRVPGLRSGPVCGDLEDFPSSRRIVFPLPKAFYYSYEDTWGAPRPQGGHEGTDLMAPSGTPEYAVTGGTVVPVAGATQNGWNPLGGYAVMVEAAYSVGPIRKGDLFYYAHLDRESTLKTGTRVRPGQAVGYAGDTGQGPEVTRGHFPPHLHLGWYDATGSRSDVASGAMNPYPLLEWIKANGGTVVGGSDARYCEAQLAGAPAVPSTGEDRWPTPPSPGVRPDLDTGSNDPRPSPVVDKGKPPKHRAEPATAAKTPQPPPGAVPETRSPTPKPPQESLASDTAGGKKHERPDERQEAEKGEDEQEGPQKDSGPSDERTSSEEDPAGSETSEPEETDEDEATAETTETESTVPEPAPETTEATTETTTE